MADEVRIGIIGTSWWTDMMFLPSFKSHPSAAVVSICGRNRTRAEELAAKYGIPEVYTNYRTLLEQKNIDAVVVATPDDLHYPMTMDALDAGLHVLCEKPMALTADHASEMYAKAEAVGVKHMVLFTWRWQPHFRFLKQLVDEDYIGRCYQAQFSFVGGFGRNQDYGWRYDSQRSNGIISDLGAHMIDFARWYIGDIRKVSASLGTFVERNGVDREQLDPSNDAGFVMLQFDNGAQAVVQASAVAHQADRGFEISVQLQGDKGTLEVDQLFTGTDASVTIRGARDKDERFSRLSIPDSFLKDLDGVDNLAPYFKQSAGPRLFVDAIAEDLSITPDFYDGLKVQEVIDAAIESHRTECTVSLP